MTKKNNNIFSKIKKINIRKNIIPVLLAGTVLTGVGVSKYKANKDKELTITSSYDNFKGYDSIGLFSTGDVCDDNFVVLDIGDHDSIETKFQDRKMKLCNNKDISLGVIVSSDAENECDIYNDVDYIKGIIRDYKVDFPVYLNIDNIINNEELNNEMKEKIIKDFLSKCSINGMYVGVCGTDTNLCKLKKLVDISEYDAYVIMDKEFISYNGVYNLYKTLDGKIYSKRDISLPINKYNLNSSSNFKADVLYTCKDNEDINDISLKYGISSNDLLKFNNIRKKDIKEGTIIRIPCDFEDCNTKKKMSNDTMVDEYLKGCDISYCQSDNNNWEIMSNNFDFVIIKCSQGLYNDGYFEENALACNAYGIPMGAYVYNAYWKDSCDLESFKLLQKQQADYAVSLLKGKKIDYPIYLDIERSGFNHEEHLSSEYTNAMLDIWYDTITKAGYIPGLYFNNYFASCIEEDTCYNLSDRFEIWLAGGPQYEAKVNNEYVKYNIDQIEVPTYFTENRYGVSMCQPGLVYGAGSGTDDGFLDFDYCKVDYTNSKNILGEKKYNDGKIKKFSRVNKIIPITTISLASLGIAGFGVKTYKRKKEKEKKKVKNGNKKK